MPPLDVLFLVGAALLVGSVVQGVAGFGVALLAAPVIALVEPALIPVTLLLATSALPVMSVVREFGDIDWQGLAWALLGRVPGTALGTWAVVVLSARALAIVVALVVLAAVALSLVRWQPGPTPRGLLVAGMASGAFGTSTGIGGPPIALLYQRESGPRIRATLAAYFTLGIVMSLVALSIAGRVHRDDVATAAVLLPFLAAGFVLSNPLRRALDRGRTRAAVLTISAASAVALVLRAVAA
ncbi:MAG: sulfite exporter TauE/SafE family protein [Actinomycetota bacterium]|nr:sulfite exporter TauE/SafE family protein [Actinomycetota bacterium]